MVDPMEEYKEFHRREAEAEAPTARKPANEIPQTFRAIEDRKYPMSRKERRRLVREARKHSAKHIPFKDVWDEMVREGAYVEA